MFLCICNNDLQNYKKVKWYFLLLDLFLYVYIYIKYDFKIMRILYIERKQFKMYGMYTSKYMLSIRSSKEVVVVVQPLSCVRLFMTPWIAVCQVSLSLPVSQSLLKLMSIELVMPSNHFVLCHPLLLPLQAFPASGFFPMSRLFASGGQSIGASASASVLPMTIQSWFPLGLTGLISLQSKGLSTVFPNTTVRKHQIKGRSQIFFEKNL